MRLPAEPNGPPCSTSARPGVLDDSAARRSRQQRGAAFSTTARRGVLDNSTPGHYYVLHGRWRSQ
jgi:hypothetical protein